MRLQLHFGIALGLAVLRRTIRSEELVPPRRNDDSQGSSGLDVKYV